MQYSARTGALQNYTYDELNRLASATETSNLTQTWTQVFGYDRYGNRNITSGTGQTSLTFGSTTNRITTSGYSYDSGGNTTADPSGKSFIYDAENKQTKVTNGGTLGEYWYDGDGKRVKKTTNTGDNVIFIYDAAGTLIEERASSNGALQTSYVYAGGRLLTKETEPATSTTYLTADHLGSPRINTDGSGNVVARHDYLPFGEEIDGTGGRTTGLGYPSGSDGIRQQFTGYERDNETDLDFAQARYFASGFGRFSSPDPLMASSQLTNPQTFNRYAYVINNPINLMDPSGMVDCKPGDNCLIPCKNGEPGCIPNSDNQIATVDVKIPESIVMLEETINPFVSTAITPRPMETLPSMSAGPQDDTGVLGLFVEFLLATGPTDRQFGPGTSMTAGMMSSPEVRAQRNSFCALANCSQAITYQGGRQFGLLGQGALGFPSEDGAARAAVESGIFSPRSFVGSFGITISGGSSESQETLFVIENHTTRQSFLYHLPVSNSSNGYFMRNTKQTYWWTERNPCNCR